MIGFQGLLLKLVPCCLHAFGHPIRKNLPLLVSAIIPFPRANISARTIEVNMKHSRGFLPLVPCHPGKVGVCESRSIVTLRVGCVVSQGDDGTFAIVKRDQLQVRINGAGRIRSNGRIGRCGPASNLDFAILIKNSAI